jgi:hypothetical protein
MSVSANTIAVGKCYQTLNKQHRRVIRIDGDNIIYESWGGNVGYNGGALNQVTVNKSKFAKDVDNEIPCPVNLPTLDKSEE